MTMNKINNYIAHQGELTFHEIMYIIFCACYITKIMMCIIFHACYNYLNTHFVVLLILLNAKLYFAFAVRIYPSLNCLLLEHFLY